MPRRFLDMHLTEAIGYYKTGYTLKYISSINGFSISTNAEHLRKAGVKMRSVITKSPDGRASKIKARYDRGESMNAIARSLGITRQRVHQIVMERGRNRTPQEESA